MSAPGTCSRESFGLLIYPEVVAPIASVRGVPERMSKDVEFSSPSLSPFHPREVAFLDLLLERDNGPRASYGSVARSERTASFFPGQNQLLLVRNIRVRTLWTCLFSSSVASRYMPGALYAHCRVSVLVQVLFPSLLVTLL